MTVEPGAETVPAGVARTAMKKLRGIAASSGIAIGLAHVFQPAVIALARHEVQDADVESEVARWREARDAAREQLAQIQVRAEATLGQAQAAIFEAHALMLDDPELLDLVEAKVRGDRLPASAAVHEAAEFYAGMLAQLGDECLSARAADVRDVAGRVIRLLHAVEDAPLAALSAPVIVAAQDLTPSDTASMNRDAVLGFCTAGGGMTSHTAILARANGWPAVVGLGESWLEIQQDELVIVDGTGGLVVVAPDAATLQAYRQSQESWCLAVGAARQSACEPAVTRDGRRFEVCANISDAGSARTALDMGAEGVGLLRSEFLFLDRATPPDEEEQYQAYRQIVQIMGRRPLVVRTLDVGGDKPPPYLSLAPEMNPFLGWRGIRISLGSPELFKVQLRALLRAAVDGNVKIMFPMVASLDEVRAARRLVEESRQELAARGAECAASVEIGIMVEVPSAAVMAPALAPEVDFFSLGTNDLTQYTLAVDRGNAKVSALYDSLHPAVLRLIQTVIEAGHGAGKWVGMCGEMAGDVQAIPLLVGLGLDEFSMNAPALPAAKELIRRLSYKDMRTLAAGVLRLGTAAEVHAAIQGAVAAPPP